MRRQVLAYVWGIAVSAIAVTGLLYFRSPQVDPALVKAGITFAVLGFVLHAFDYALVRNASATSALLPFLAALFLAPHWTTVVAIAGTCALKELLARRDLLKGIFNICQCTLAAGVSAAVYLLLGARPFLEEQQLVVVPYVALFLLFHTTNALSVSIVVALSSGKSVSEVWKANTLSTLPYDVLSLPFVYAFGVVYLHWEVMGAFALALPLLGMRQLYKTNWQLEKVNQELLELMVAAIEARDPYTSGHSRRVSRYARIIAKAMGLSSHTVERVRIAALLHDVGKIHEVYAPLLRKAGKLDSHERAVMETHPLKSAELVDKVSSLRDIVDSVRHHHENWDGSGYPSGLSGDAIPLAARIIMVADTIDAMTTDRPYRRALTEADVKFELERKRGQQFDPIICETMLSTGALSEIFSSSSTRRKTPRGYTPPESAPQVISA